MTRKGVKDAGSPKPITISVNPKIYPLDVIYTTAYVFLDNYYIIIDGDPEKEILIRVFPKAEDSSGGKPHENIEKEFNNMLINYSLYKVQSERSSEVRKYIMQRALATAELSSSPVAAGSKEPDESTQFTDADFIDDPEGIAIPWEEKFGKKKKDGDQHDNSNGTAKKEGKD